ncbi:DUF1800 domain-containing protein [Aquimarina algiphila]|uniref:DUF1800 domain-containing protein n=1 Tax=Aquimarina algiphila TaxID=2047982 RepID=UPI002490E6D4|nr:DUF1800 domain-containing protein [Aquimarina algiphila]
MNTLSDKEIQHLYWRFGFGISPSQLKTARILSKRQIIDQLFSESRQSTALTMDLGALEKNPSELSKEERKKLRKLQRKKMNELNIIWFTQLTTTEEILREKMTLFFHNHFAVRLKMPRVCIHLNNIIRKHALGNFGDMLMEVSKSPAMLIFLNNRQNRKNHPNENFAREVMELFTLGRDNGYTEKDIKEAARAFTGWNFKKDGAFIFRSNHHDYGTKTVLGKTGDFTGEDVIKILLKEKQTAKYITKKFYQYFVNPIPDQDRIKQLSNILYNSDYDLRVLIQSTIESNWFYNTKNIGVKIKSPIELMVGLNRPFKVKYDDPKVILYLQRKLNQMLFFPPNVAGWPGGKTWIDNSTLMLRLKLASVILNSGIIEWNDKGDMPENVMMKQKYYQKMKTQIEKKVKATPDWDNFMSGLDQKDKITLSYYLLQPEPSKIAKKVLKDLDSSDTKNFIVELLSLPEYQLC